MKGMHVRPLYGKITTVKSLLALFASLAAAAASSETAESLAEIARERELMHVFRYDVECDVVGAIHSVDNVDYLFLSDATGRAFAMPTLAKGGKRLESGDHVRICGRHDGTNDEYNLHPLYPSSATLLRHGTPPAPLAATVREIADGKFDFRPVSTAGLVRDVAASETSRHWASISLFDEGELLRVAVPLAKTPIEKYEKLIGRRIEVIGFPNPTSGSRRMFAGRVLHCAGLSAIRMPDQEPVDPFAAPDLKSLAAKTAAQIASFGFVRASGCVLCVWGNRAIVKTPSGDSVRIVFDAESPPECGDTVECAGLPLTDVFHITLVRAKWRRTTLPDVIPETSPSFVRAIEIKANDTIQESYHGRNITLRGKLFVTNGADGEIEGVTVEDGGVTVELRAPAGWPAGIATGCFAQATGICVMESGVWQPETVVPRLRDIAVVVRSPEDLLILKSPPWWTPARLSIVVCSLLAALIGLFAWNRSLNNLAERRGRRLLAEEIGRVKADLKATERTRLAVELHDSLVQNLAGVSMEIQTAARYGTDDIDEHMHHLAIADTALKSCLQNLRSTLWDLRSLSLDEPDVESAIRRTLLPHVKGVRLSVDFPASRRKMTEQELHEVLRIIRELTINAIRHGEAKSILVQGRIEGNEVTFSVRDDGCGFDPSACPGVAEGHFGLQGVRDRLRGLNGTMKIDSARGHGAYAEISIRLRHNEG